MNALLFFVCENPHAPFIGGLSLEREPIFETNRFRNRRGFGRAGVSAGRRQRKVPAEQVRWRQMAYIPAPCWH